MAPLIIVSIIYFSCLMMINFMIGINQLWRGMNHVEAELCVVPADMWIGCCWDADNSKLYTCMIPCIVLKVTFTI